MGYRSARKAVAALVVLTTMAVPGLRSNAASLSAGQTVSLTFDSKTMKLSGFPAKLNGGLTTIRVTGGSYGVNIALARVSGTRTDKEIQAAVTSQDAPPPSWATFFGGTAAGAKDGTTRTATVNFDKGNYIWVVSSDHSELDGKSPWGRFTVSGPKAATNPSGGTATVTTNEYGFDLKGLKPGLNTVTYRNAGKETHHIIMFKLRPGKAAADFLKMFQSQKFDDSVDESEFINNLPLLSSGVSQTADIKLEKGKYAFVCFMPDKTGTPHILKGMIKDVTIV